MDYRRTDRRRTDLLRAALEDARNDERLAAWRERFTAHFGRPPMPFIRPPVHRQRSTPSAQRVAEALMLQALQTTPRRRASMEICGNE